MKYTVEHYHKKLFGWTYEELLQQLEVRNAPTIYTVEAATPKDAAIIAHAMWEAEATRKNGIVDIETMNTITAPDYVVATAHEKYAHRITCGAKRSDGTSVYVYDDIAGHAIIVRTDETTNPHD